MSYLIIKIKSENSLAKFIGYSPISIPRFVGENLTNCLIHWPSFHKLVFICQKT